VAVVATNLAALQAAAAVAARMKPNADLLAKSASRAAPAAPAAAATAATAAAAAAAPFEWADGPLVTAMRTGAVLLVDEVNLADDAVLERLNSVLEPGRALTLAEKGGATSGETSAGASANAGAELVIAHPDFRVIATMNPGGDYGKRELSPALANRFTTVWAPAPTDRAELEAMVCARLAAPEPRTAAGPALLDWWEALAGAAGAVGAPAPPLRDLLAAARLVNDLAAGPAGLPPLAALAHAAHGAVLDGLAACSGGGISLASAGAAALATVLRSHGAPESAVSSAAGPGGDRSTPPSLTPDGRAWGVPPFTIPVCGPTPAPPRFAFSAPAVARNATRLLRAVCAGRPVLLEGAPGVGKTALVTAVAAAAGRPLVRINLSEQTDVADLLGGDLPVAAAAADGDALPSAGPAFAWTDGPLLAALRSGAWVLLDELNLAGPAVLEGLNAILDHRRTVYLPELGISVEAPPSFAVFAAQNDAADGGGRRRLPRSFISRFSRVWAEPLGAVDCRAVLAALHPRVPRPLADRLTQAVSAVSSLRLTGPGGPWEFNLRDLLRWAEAVEADPALAGVRCVLSFEF